METDTIDSSRIFFALTRRLERVHAERRRAWMMGDDGLNDRLMRRVSRLQQVIFTLKLS